MKTWSVKFIGALLVALLFLPSLTFARSLSDFLNDENVGNVLNAAILLNDDAAEKIVSTLGSAEVEKKGISTDPALISRADRVFRRVAAGATKKNYRLKVLNDSTVNACAVLGGHLYINHGLLTLPGLTDDEIAAVLGHEIAHIEKRHGLGQIRQAMLAGFVAGKLTNKGKQQAVATLVGQLWVSGRSQKDEKEADLVGAHLARAAGYNPTGAVAFMRRLEVMSRNERSRHPGGSALLAGLEQRLSSHPPTNKRCEYLKDDLFAAKYGQSFRLSEDASRQVASVSTAKGRDSILLQQTPIHIGDDKAGISTIWSKIFNLTSNDLSGRTSAKVTFLLRSTEIRRDPHVYFNRVHVGFAVTQSRNWERFEFAVPIGALHAGDNLIDIETIIPDLWRTYDDCEFRDVKLLLTGEQLDPHIAWNFDYPVGDLDASNRRAGAGWYVSQDFADTVNPLSDALRGQHLGEDWLLLHNRRRNGSFAEEPVRSIANGQVILAGDHKSYGHIVMIRHPLPPHSDLPYVVSLYGHIGEEDLPAPNQWVARGKIIGHIAPRGENGVSRTGEMWPEHLHFELRADSGRTGFPDDQVDVHGRIGYSADQDGFLNPTDATSPGNKPGDGWIDSHR